jgi:hypothetical protein
MMGLGPSHRANPWMERGGMGDRVDDRLGAGADGWMHTS